nr:unnamed protein product [Callosobruchus analis]
METGFFGLTPKDLRRMVFEVAEKNKMKHVFNCEKKLAGWKWVKGFPKRNPHISLRSPESTSLARAQAFNEPNIDAYFKALSNILDQYKFLPENIYNMEVSGLTTVQKDGHSIHKGLDALQFAKESGVIVFCFPAHCSHHVQPLDVGFFRPLHTYFDQEIQLWLRQNPGKAATQFKIASLLNEAYLKSAVPANAINSFKKTGIHPFNPHVFENWQFSPALATDKQFLQTKTDMTEKNVELEDQPVIICLPHQSLTSQ